MQEINELQLSDTTLSPKTENFRVTARMSSIKLTEIDFETAKLDI